MQRLMVALLLVLVMSLTPAKCGAAVPTPIINVGFNEGSGAVAANSGSAGGELTLTTPIPTWSSNVPVGVGGRSSVDFGTTYANYCVESPANYAQLTGLVKFTVAGWVNCRNSTEGSGGNRLVTWINHGGEGVDVVYKSDGSVQVGIDQWPDGSPPRSTAGKIPTDPAAGVDNWRFFAVTYDSTLASGHVKFYFGSSAEIATFDVAKDYSRGPVGTSISRLCIGHFNVATRSTALDRMFRGLIDEVKVFGDALTLDQIQEIQRGNPETAKAPSPADSAQDVPRDVTLSWTPGAFAGTHDVYFGTSATEVNAASRQSTMGVLAGQGQATAEYDPEGLLEYGQTYYWRIDEVNATPDNTVFKGKVWSFTAEPFAYPLRNVTATASSSSRADTMAENTLNGSGLNANDEHSVDVTQMWMSSAAKPHWIQYQFDRIYKLDSLWVWNSNQIIESFVGFGARDVTIEYSSDGATWTVLEGVPEFARGTGLPTYKANTTVDFGGVMAKFVRLTINSNWGAAAPSSLSEVRFFHIPVQAREPQPAVGATGVSLDVELNWRPGREGQSHAVYFGDNQAAVAAGSVPAQAVAKHSYAPASLDFGTKYFWKIDEVGDAGTYAGDVWSFATQEYAPIDNFETYTDDEGSRIYESWIDGLTNKLSGSTVGHMQAPFAEKSVVHGGGQSMPMTYDNSTSPYYSEAELEFDTPQNWTVGAATNLSLYYHGASPAFVATSSGGILMNGIGSDIWGTSDQFRFAYKSLNGNGSIVARVLSVYNSNTWAKAGVMIRQSTEPGSTHAFMAKTAVDGNGASFQRRLTASGDSTNTDAATAVAAPYWVKVERVGDKFSGYISPDGVTWTQLGTAQTIAMTGPVLIGLAVCSHDAAVVTNAEFSGVTTAGNVAGDWQMAEIGVEQQGGNSPEAIYLTVKDNSGKSRTVVNPDPVATARMGWRQWTIPLSEFTSAGVKMTAVKSIVIGAGNKTNPAGGGAGVIYIDDIGYGRPLP
jgi:hypothetical protein